MELSTLEKEKLKNDFGSEISRIVTKMIPAIKNTYEDIALIDLLMALPIKFDFAEIDLSLIQPLPSGVVPKPEAFAIGGYITRDTESGNPDRLTVFFTFTKDKNMSWNEYFDWAINSREIIANAAFTYLHEALHILNRHYDFYLNRTYEAIIQEVRPDIESTEMHDLLNYAFDYWINAFLIENAANNSIISHYKDSNNFASLYDPELSPAKLTQQEIVRKLALEAEICKNDIPGVGHQVTIQINGNSSSTLYVNGSHAPATQGTTETPHEQEINEVLDSTRQQLLDKTRGTNNSGTLKNLGVSYEVPVDWFNHLKSSLFNVVQRYTNRSDQTWSKLKNKFRHVATLPGRIYYDKSLAAVISIDQSGSMSDDDLRKINYVVGELAKKAQFIEVLLHDTSVASRERFVGFKQMEITKFITNRVACGGTSHREVFEIVDEIQKDNPKTKLIYLSFSDNYSDIEQVYSDDVFRRVTPYWITTDERRPVQVPGMQISLENGLLQV